MASKHDLYGHYAIVTGGAGGIGLEFAKALAEMKCNLLLIDRDGDRLNHASLIIKEGKQDIQINTLELDLTDLHVTEKLEEFCESNHIDPDILINNAGIFSFSPIVATQIRKIETFLDLHVRAVTLLSRWFCSKGGEKKERWLLNMSSMSCWMPMPGLAMYASTKSYIRVFSRSLHYEMKGEGVHVMVACPGGIATDLFGLPDNLKKFAVGVKVLDTPEKFVRKALKKLFKGKKQYINGGLNRFSIFFVGITPDWVRMLVKHKLLDKGIQR